MTKKEFIHRLTIQGLSQIVYDKVGSSPGGSGTAYALRASHEAERAADHLEKEDAHYFDRDRDEEERKRAIARVCG